MARPILLPHSRVQSQGSTASLNKLSKPCPKCHIFHVYFYRIVKTKLQLQLNKIKCLNNKNLNKFKTV